MDRGIAYTCRYSCSARYTYTHSHYLLQFINFCRILTFREYTIAMYNCELQGKMKEKKRPEKGQEKNPSHLWKSFVSLLLFFTVDLSFWFRQLLAAFSEQKKEIRLKLLLYLLHTASSTAVSAFDIFQGSLIVAFYTLYSILGVWYGMMEKEINCNECIGQRWKYHIFREKVSGAGYSHAKTN